MWLSLWLIPHLLLPHYTSFPAFAASSYPSLMFLSSLHLISLFFFFTYFYSPLLVHPSALPHSSSSPLFSLPYPFPLSTPLPSFFSWAPQASQRPTAVLTQLTLTNTVLTWSMTLIRLLSSSCSLFLLLSTIAPYFSQSSPDIGYISGAMGIAEWQEGAVCAQHFLRTQMGTEPGGTQRRAGHRASTPGTLSNQEGGCSKHRVWARFMSKSQTLKYVDVVWLMPDVQCMVCTCVISNVFLLVHLTDRRMVVH